MLEHRLNFLLDHDRAHHYFPGRLPAGAKSLSHFTSRGGSAISLFRDTSELEAPFPRVELCHLPRV